MPPTRGHDLKLKMAKIIGYRRMDAPHTGARLETSSIGISPTTFHDAPHTGARLETYVMLEVLGDIATMPPTRGHDLKQAGKYE